MTLEKQKKLVSLGLMLILLNGCVANSREKTSNFCLLYNPVYTHESDTETTKSNVDDNNIVWMDLCDVE